MLLLTWCTFPAYNENQTVSEGRTWKNELTKIAFRQEVMVDRRGGAGHGGGEYSGGGTLNNQPADDKKAKPNHRGHNSCSTNHIGLARLLFLLLPSFFLIFIFHGF